MILYGIANCDTVKKARKFLQSLAVEYQFYDIRQQGLPLALLEQWQQTVGWEVLLNKRSTTWNQLAADLKTDLNTEKALELMRAYPTLVKRPVLAYKDKILVGFSAELYEDLMR